jgi:hypothetical protein
MNEKNLEILSVGHKGQPTEPSKSAASARFAAIKFIPKSCKV